jgi:hypothetical protein
MIYGMSWREKRGAWSGSPNGSSKITGLDMRVYNGVA